MEDIYIPLRYRITDVLRIKVNNNSHKQGTYYQRNIAKMREYQHNRYIAKKEEICAKQREYNKKHREACRKHNAEYRIKHPERCAEYQRRSNQKKRLRNIEENAMVMLAAISTVTDVDIEICKQERLRRKREYAKQWRKNNRDAIAEYQRQWRAKQRSL